MRRSLKCIDHEDSIHMDGISVLVKWVLLPLPPNKDTEEAIHKEQVHSRKQSFWHLNLRLLSLQDCELQGSNAHEMPCLKYFAVATHMEEDNIYFC